MKRPPSKTWPPFSFEKKHGKSCKKQNMLKSIPFSSTPFFQRAGKNKLNIITGYTKMIDASDKGAQICHNWISSPCRHIQMNARQYQEPVDLPVQPIRHATNIHSLTPPRTDRHLSQSANACWLVVGGWCFGFFWEGPLSTLLMEKCQESKPPGPQTNNEPLSLAQLFDKDRNILQPVTGERENIL